MGLRESLEKRALNTANRYGSRERFDPHTFNDEKALQIEWTPAKGGGSNFGTHTLKETGMGRMEFVAGRGTYLFSGVFMFVGSSVAIGTTIGALTSSEYIVMLFGVPFGLLFLFVGYFIMKSLTMPRIFDKNAGFYWRGKKESEYENEKDIKESCKLREIHALQLISEYIHSNKSNYYSYELNLILEDNRRINVIDHGNIHQLREDAHKLSHFLHVPLWDAT